MPLAKRYCLKLNNINKIEELLQELYNEADKTIVELQNQINILKNSIQLNEEIVDGKAKYAKAINDFINSKDKAIGRKLEIAKLMAEIHKYNGNVKAAMEDDNSVGNWDFLKDNLDTGVIETTPEEKVVERYQMKRKKKEN
jgi:predicted oxidoreductase (fatty acid repression mutant protein)